MMPTIPGFVMSTATRADVPEWAEFMAQPEMNRFVSAPITAEADLFAVVERTLSSEPDAPVHFVVRDESSRRLVASVGFHSVSARNRSAEITFGVRSDHWGQGLATACCKAALSWAFHHRSWVRVQGTTLEENAASQRVLLKSGFAFEGKLRNFRIVRDEPRDYFLYSCVPTTGTGQLR